MSESQRLIVILDLFKNLPIFSHNLSPLAERCRRGDVNFSDQHLVIFKQRVDLLNSTLEKIQTNLEKEIYKLGKLWYRISRVYTTNDWLSKFEGTARVADRLVLDVMTCTTNMTQAIVNLTSMTDEFQPSFDEIPPNPPHVVLNFASISNVDEATLASLTVETKLKQAVLRSDGAASAATVTPRLASRQRMGISGVRGMSGAGKSCALRALARDVEVRAHFRDGIYFMVLGKAATDAGVMQGIITIMSRSGSKRLAEEAREGSDIEEVTSKARQWFKGKCVLLAIDDVWGESDSRRDIVGRLASMVDIPVGSRVVFSTKEARMVTGSEVIHFAERGRQASREILLSAAGLKDEDVAGCEGIVDEVAGYCGGIPMALAVAGNAIKIELKAFGMQTTAHVLQEYANGLQSCCQPLVKGTIGNDSYQNLESAFKASLEMLKKSERQRLAFKCELSFLEMYRALAVLRRQG